MRRKKGFALLFSILLLSVSFTISFSVFNLVNREFQISRDAKDEFAAFQKADAGSECALFWNLRTDYFKDTTTKTIRCNNVDVSITPVYVGDVPDPPGPPAPLYETTFNVPFSDGSCYEVVVTRVVPPPPRLSKWTISSRGQRSCAVGEKSFQEVRFWSSE